MKDGTYPLVIQIICKRQKKQIGTLYHLQEAEFDMHTEQMLYVSPVNTRSKVKEANKELHKKVAEISKLLEGLEAEHPDCTIHDFMNLYKAKEAKDNFLDFMEEQINFKKSMKKDGISRAYKSTLNSLKKFSDGQILRFSEITPVLVDKYECYLTQRVDPNTVGYYMRNFKAVYNRWKKIHAMHVAENPFANVRTSISKTRKRALKKEDIVKISHIDMASQPDRERARDIFLFSFHAMGMAFVDIMRLKKENLDKEGDMIFYYRTKTNQMIRVPLNMHAKAILERYGSEDSEYLFAFIDPANHADKSFYQVYRSELGRTNHQLKMLGKELQLGVPLTTYVARHSWATEANRTGVPISVISAGLGHTSIRTTEIYLKEIDLSAIKRLNDCVTCMG